MRFKYREEPMLRSLSLHACEKSSSACPLACRSADPSGFENQPLLHPDAFRQRLYAVGARRLTRGRSRLPVPKQVRTPEIKTSLYKIMHKASGQSVGGGDERIPKNTPHIYPHCTDARWNRTGSLAGSHWPDVTGRISPDRKNKRNPC